MRVKRATDNLGPREEETEERENVSSKSFGIREGSLNGDVTSEMLASSTKSKEVVQSSPIKVNDILILYVF